jgi:UbiD family decarboxylase
LLANTFASREACALALGLPAAKSGLALVLEFQRREAGRMKPLIIGRKAAPVKEMVAQPNLHALPILTHHLEDKGPYLTMTWSAKDLESGVYNSSFHRCYVRDERHLVMFFERRHLWEYYLRAERRDEPLPVACVIGHHPSYYLGNCALTGIEVDEYESIGGIMGEPLRLVPSETFGERLLVPADAEMVIEGRILPHQRDMEGPFGDFTGYYGPPTESPIVEISAITHRRDAICMDIFVGHREHALLGEIPKEGSIYRKVQNVVPTVTAVCLPVSGTPVPLGIIIEKALKERQSSRLWRLLRDRSSSSTSSSSIRTSTSTMRRRCSGPSPPAWTRLRMLPLSTASREAGSIPSIRERIGDRR